MDEIEKFKRKLIRSVMSIWLRDKQPYETVWAELKKDTGRDCEMLWHRMCAITTKKLARLLAADDERARVSPSARMASADWLLVDLVLVHEKPDVIGTDTASPEASAEPAAELPALRRLFQLVAKHEIEGCSNFTRTRRWVQLTHDYNKQGRECSPMLLQLRWYQMKERTRNHFYEFWHAYRGNKSNLLKSSCRPPCALYIDIARQFPVVVTELFPDWSELVTNRAVILPEHFNRFGRTARDVRPLYAGDLFIMRASLKAKAAAAQTIDTEPDLVIVEPKIDTIELDCDSETEEIENQPENNEEVETNTEISAAVAEITRALDEDGLSNVQIVEATHVPTEEIDSEQPSKDICMKTESLPNEEDLDESHLNDNETEFASMTDSLAKADEIAEEHAMEVKEEQAELGSSTSESNDIQSVQSPEQQEVVEQVLKEKLDTMREETQAEIHDIDIDENDTLFTNEGPTEVNLQDLVSKIKEELTEDTDKGEPEEGISSLVIGKLPSNLELIDDGIDFIDDDEEDDIIMMNNCPEAMTSTSIEVKKEEEEQENEEPEKEEQPKFDLKLMMLPVVYTTKLELMKSLKHSDYEYIDTTGIMDSILEESKPISALSVNIKYEVEVDTPEVNSDKIANEDLLKISEATYEVPLAAPEMNGSEDLVKITEANAMTTESVDMDAADDSDSSDDGIPECKRVKLTSSLFKKPQGRTYNPIQLCKNPDFNTRLRRLSAGFLTYERNRRYLTRIKPLTIDLHKSFEQKLIDKTLYLMPDPNAPKPALNKQEHLVTSVLPTATPVCSLLDNTKSEGNSGIVNLIDEELAQRKNKVIELPDIAKVRRMNQHLLTAEVSPIQVINDQTTKKILVSPLINTTGNREIEEKLPDDASTPQDFQDNNPLLEAPKAGESTKVKVELVDDDEDEQNLAETVKYEKAPTPELSKNENQHQSVKTTDTAPEAAKPRKHKYTPKGTKEYPKRPWYMPALTPINSHFEIKDSSDPTKIPWWKQNPYKNLTDTSLLTHDTLNKMILLIEGKDEKEKKTKKSHKKAPVPPPPKPVEDPCIDLSTTEDMPAVEKVKKENLDVAPVAETVSLKMCKTRVRNPQNPVYCCYFNRINVINARRKRSRSRRTWRPKHKCPENNCICCCREGDGIEPKAKKPDKPKPERLLGELQTCCWASKMIKIFKERKKYESLKWLPVHSCLADGNKKCTCCCKEALDTVAGVVEKICQQAKETEEMKEIANAVNLINKPISETRLFRKVPAATVVNDGTVPFENILHTYLDIAKTANCFPGIPGCSKQSPEVSQQKASLECIESIDVDSNSEESNPNPEPQVHMDTTAQVTPQGSVATEQSAPKLDRSTDAPVNTSTESDQFIVLSDDETDSAPTTQSCANIIPPVKSIIRPKTETLPSRTVIITPKPKFIIKCFKNLMHACPVRLGPNKILLTTAKIPVEILMPQPKVALPAPPTPACMTNVELPKGVHFVMEPNGTLTCAFEPNINLDEKTLIDLKNIVSVVQEQLKNETLAVTAPPTVGDTVTLSDDDNSGDKTAEPSTCGDQGVVNHPTQEESSLPAAENDIECTSQEIAGEEEPEKNVSKEGQIVADGSGKLPEKIMEVCENLADADATQPKIVGNTTDATITVDDSSSNTNTVEVSNATNTVDEVTNVTNTVDEIPNVTNTVDKVPNVTNAVDELTNVANTVDEVTNVTNTVDEVTNVTNTVDNVLSTVDEASEILVTQPVEKVSEDTEDKADAIQTQKLDALTEDIANGAQSQPVDEITEDQDKTSTVGEETAAESEEKTEEDSHLNKERPTEETEQNVSQNNETETEITTPDNNSAPTDTHYTGEAVTQEHSKEETPTAQPRVSTKKSILSDLMEMSGISSEDVLPSVEDGPPPLMPLQAQAVVVEPEADGPTELTQVTNVAALKYAVAQKAQFFRYTIGTGALAAIEVALQSSRIPRNLAPSQRPAAVVDLTEAAPARSLRPKLVPPEDIPRTRGGNPIIIRKVTSSRVPVLTITPPVSQAGRSLLKPPVVRLQERRRPGRPRKQLIEPTIYNLDATDGEMEEEYLLDSEQEDDNADPKQTISVLKNLLALERAKRAAVTEQARGSSSDDEPLIKKVKRKKRAKKIKKKVKKVKKQLKLIQKAADTYSIVSEETQAVTDSVAEELAKEGEAWLDPSGEESDNFILGA